MGIVAGTETVEKLKLLVVQLRKWNTAINLVSPATLEDAWSRHVEDSARLAVLVAPPRRWVDLGSGAGFPGLVVAALLAERSPSSEVALVESDRRKAVFLRTTAVLMGLSVKVWDSRVEQVPPLAGGVVSARALAPLDRLLPMASRHLAENGVCLFPKGARVAEELASVAGKWSFDVVRHRSANTGQGDVLEIRNLRHG